MLETAIPPGASPPTPAVPPGSLWSAALRLPNRASFETARVATHEGTRLDLEAAMATLPDATRTVFVMHDVEGYTHEEIAHLTGRAEGTCKTLLHRARRMLRERLK